MRRKIVTVCIVLACFLLESTVFPNISLISVTPNLLMIVTASFGFMRGKKEGMAVGFLSGLLEDVMFGELVGFYALIFTLLGYANGFFKRLFYNYDIKLPLILIAASDFVYGNAVCLFMFIMRSRFRYFYYLVNIIIPELIYTVLITLILYPLIRHINQWLETKEKRSGGKFV